MKKILSILAAFFVMIGFANTAISSTMNDVSANYWAVKEIQSVVANGVMTVDSNGKFNPGHSVTRAQFNSMLLRALGHKQTAATVENKFVDVSTSHWAYDDILRSEQIGLIYGYPDNKFRPERTITKAETASIISHITKEKECSASVLDKFNDGNSVPQWAKMQYAKTIDMGIYVNYPDANTLLPNKVLNRAEAAVLLHKLMLAFNLVKEQYLGNEALIAVEHLDISKKAECDEVKITNLRNIIVSGNVVKAYFEFPFSSKTSYEGQPVSLVVKKDIYTKEGTYVIPRNTKIEGYVACITPAQKFNKNAEVTLNLTRVVLPNGQAIPCNVQVYENDGVLSASKLATTGKLTAYTLAGAAVGAGAGVGVAAIPDPERYGRGVAIGTPIGAVLGLGTGFLTKGLPYKAGCNDDILLILRSDLGLPKVK